MRRILCSLAILGSVGVLNASQQPTAVLPLPGQSQPAPPQQPASLKGFEGTWVFDMPRDAAERDLVLTIVRDGNAIVLKAVTGKQEIVTRYDVTGADVTNTSFGHKAIFRSRIDGQKLVTQIWDNEAVGPPARIETRYMASADRMMTELSETPGGPVMNKAVLRRK